MTSSAPTRGTTAQPYSAAAYKRQLTISQAERQHRVMPNNQMCTSAQMQLDNINRMIAAAENEYRKTLSDLDKDNWEGRGWLVVDFIHKTSLASLDMAASLLQIASRGTPLDRLTSDAARKIADGTQTLSDTIGIAGNMYNQTGSAKDAMRTLGSRVLTHRDPKGVGGVLAKSSADMALTGWSNIDNITGASGTDARSSRGKEASVDLAAQAVQRAADTIDKAAGPAGNQTAKKVSSVAQLSRAMASYNREIEGVFDRRLETYTSNVNSRALVKAAFDRNMTNFRRQSAEITRILASCQ